MFRRSFTRIATTLIFVGASGLVACDNQNGEAQQDAVVEAQPVFVDSVFPIEEEIRRFRAGIGEPVVALQDGAASVDELVQTFLDALERADRSTLAVLSLSVEEFAYLYYPETHFTRPPYEMSPALVWFQLDTAGSAGLERALQRYGGRDLLSDGFVCPNDVVVEGRNKLLEACVVKLKEGREPPVDVSLFGAILERDGRYKFLTYGNQL